MFANIFSDVCDFGQMCEQFSDCAEHLLRDFVPDSFFEVISLWQVIMLVFDVVPVFIARRQIAAWRWQEKENPDHPMAPDEIRDCTSGFQFQANFSLVQFAICQYNFEHGEELCMLSCLDAYHKDCIGEWLQDHSHCPLCKRNVETMVEETPVRGLK